MSLLFFDGFEGGSQVVKPEWNGTATVLFSAANARTGSGYLSGSGTATLTIPASSKVTVGWAGYTPSASNIGLTVKGDAGATSHLSVLAMAGGAITLRLGTTAGTVLATAAVNFPTAEWHSLQVQATIADSGGRCTVKLDGTTIIDFTGDTKNAGTSTNIDALSFSTPSAARVDDLWVCDGVDASATQGHPNNDFLGDLKVQAVLPDGAGASTQWTPSGAGANYTMVDEAPANTTDYVSTSTVGNRDLYTVQDLPTNTVTVYGVRVGAYVQKSDAGAANVKTAIRESASGTVTTSSSVALSTTWGSAHGAYRWVKPSDSTTWTVTDVNGMQVGIESA